MTHRTFAPVMQGAPNRITYLEFWMDNARWYFHKDCGRKWMVPIDGMAQTGHNVECDDCAKVLQPMEDEAFSVHLARDRMLAWATGKLSNINIFMGAESSTEQRPYTLAAVDVADAAAVQKYAALYTALRQEAQDG